MRINYSCQSVGSSCWGNQHSSKAIADGIKVAFGTLPIKIISNVDYHLERLPPFKLLVMLNAVFGMYR